MFDGSCSTSRIALAVGLLMLAPLAGCLEPVGEAAQDAVRDGAPAEETGEEDAAGEAEADGLEEDEVSETYESAFKRVEPGNETLDRVSMDIHIDVRTEEEVFDVGAYWNSRDKIVVVSFENGTPGAENPVQSDMMEGLLFGTVNKTTFLGVPPALMTDYNESETWEEDPFNFSDAGSEDSQATGSSGDSMDFSSMLDELDELPEEANVSWNTITYEGDRAHEIEVQHENETAYLDLRAVVDLENERPLLLEGTFANDTQERVYLEVAFAYGEDADHEYADDLVRMEAMAITREDNRSLLGGSNETQNWTVLPSQNPGTIPLEEVEVHLQSDQGGTSPTNSETQAKLPAEDGRLVTEHVELVYEDSDGDGAVSPGDEIRFTPLSEEAQSWSLSLYDEETGMRSMPGPGFAAVLASLAGLGLLARERRRSG